MCGIAGVVERGAMVEERSLVLASTLEHRGPDSSGAYARPGAAVAQSRLRIIDLVTGDPPITNEDSTIGVALNGEIYNYRQLRAGLEQAGHRFRTTGDTEVIAHLAEEVDPLELCRRLDGMFAFALWDDVRQRLVLGRDRFGKKPLYYWTDGRRFVFGSEIKAVVADAAVPRRLDEEAIDAYLTFGYVPTPHTFFAGVMSVPPAHVLTFDSNGVVGLERYWSLPLPGVDGCEPFDIDFEEARREVRRLLCDAVDRRLVADVPLGAFLSGGVDSSSVVAFMARLSPSPVRTFTIGFEDTEGFDERPFAARVAAQFNTDHTEFVVQPDKAALIERLVDHHDQPFGDSSALPTFLLSELTGQHVTVALSGDGGDELFAGYERFAAAVALDRARTLPNGLLRTATRIAHTLPPTMLNGRVGNIDRMLARADADTIDAYLSWLSYVPDVWRQRLRPTASNLASKRYRGQWEDTDGADTVLDRLLHLNVGTYLLDDLLPKVDRMAMAHGLEVRSPFLDSELAEFAARLPPAFKVRGLSLKRVLKAAVGDLLPPTVLNRRKRGFGVPLDRWFRTDLRSYAEAQLLSSQSRVQSHCEPDAVRSLLAQHQAGTNLGHAIWTLLTLEVFLRREGW
jgi:asparagine synthase (glutamine-hydrolysing)